MKLGTFAFALVVLTAGTAASAGVGGEHDIVNFRKDSFVAFENGGSAAVEISRCCHGTSDSAVEVSTEDGTAAAGMDYTATTKTLRFTEPVEDAEAAIALTDDAEQEPVETFEAVLAKADGSASVSFPSRATVTIVDDDGPSRISLAAGSAEVFENRVELEIMLVRSGDASSSASVSYTTADESATAGSDYSRATGTVTFAATERVKRVRIPVADDDRNEGTETFTVSLSAPMGAEISEPSALRGAILDDETPGSDVTPPLTAFHQPLHGRTYRSGSMRDLMVFADDEGSGIDKVQIALRKKMRSGGCRWFDKPMRRFVRGPCDQRRWMTLKGSDLVVYSLPRPLPESTSGNRVRFYKAWSRGIDALGNVERSFERARNVSRFEIR
ncbi:MAG: Calx-beta domain-containing protein [Actinomycetota bacterium]